MEEEREPAVVALADLKGPVLVKIRREPPPGIELDALANGEQEERDDPLF